MEIKAMIIFQLLLDLLLGIFLLWFIWRREGPSEGKAPGRQSQAAVKRDIRRWETTSKELVQRMQSQVRALETLAADLDRAEIRAAETLERIARTEVNWASSRERYDRASDWIRKGTPIEEVAQRTGFGIDELRLMQQLSVSEQSAG